MPRRLRTWLLRKLMPQCGCVALADGTMIVRQSGEFYRYCYGPGYDRWQQDRTAQQARKGEGE